MEPKFQSSFIPKGPLTTSASFAARSAEKKQGILGYIAKFIFIVSLLAAGGSFGYVKYLESSIDKKASDLEAAKAALEPETIKELTRLNTRIQVTQTLLNKHRAITPFFDYLQSATMKNVKFTSFVFTFNEKGPSIAMKGMARGYAAVALQSDEFNKSKYIKTPVFSNLNLDDKGNVLFEFKANLDPQILAFKKDVVKSTPTPTATVGTTTPLTKSATSTPRSATSTPR
ncbi:MAG: protein of unknown function with transrane region [Parcubacteria group bacterium]|nr:protein of unknown function with transrane region [Parcubacteria group bacterium]